MRVLDPEDHRVWIMLFSFNLQANEQQRDRNSYQLYAWKFDSQAKMAQDIDGCYLSCIEANALHVSATKMFDFMSRHLIHLYNIELGLIQQ